jgi:hypothetical protein
MHREVSVGIVTHGEDGLPAWGWWVIRNSIGFLRIRNPGDSPIFRVGGA